MAITTMTVKKGTSSGNFEPGWKKVSVKSASYGSLDNGAKYIDVYFNEYPDTFNLRVYAKTNKDNEEFAIANLFRFSNAGIEEVVKSQSDESITNVKINDAASGLVSKEMWIYLYKNQEGYSRVLQRIAPVEFEGELDKFNENDVSYWKGKAEVYFKQWVEPNISSTVMQQTDDAPF